jgi:OOP family OmpA-OmpF porin
MKHYKLVMVAVMLAFVLGACTGTGGKTAWYDQWGSCGAAGAATGIAIGATDDFDASMVGAAGGFIIGGAICAMGDTDADGVKNYKDDCRGTAAGGIVDDRGCELDSDNDGVVDRLDECPGTTAGVQVDARGCEVDSDGDGVPNSRDKCPGTPAGAKVDSNGCELDGDGDGVVDSKDKCPATPKGRAVDNYGCTLDAEYKLEHVNFEFDSAKLTSGSTMNLDEAVKILKRHSDLKVEIAGHTDSQGNDDYNMGLSERRAQAVADYLIGHGANSANIFVKGYGETDPVSDNGTMEGRAANRRVELRH